MGGLVCLESANQRMSDDLQRSAPTGILEVEGQLWERILSGKRGLSS